MKQGFKNGDKEFRGNHRIALSQLQKYFATQIYINNNYNVALVGKLLQHSDLKIA